MKRNCRRSDLERQQHEQATRIRKMTDAQICEYIEQLQHAAVNKAEVIENFIDDIGQVGTLGLRLSARTIEKIRKIAVSLGYLA